jgi:hypothetical protein
MSTLIRSVKVQREATNPDVAEPTYLNKRLRLRSEKQDSQPVNDPFAASSSFSTW